MSIDEPHVYDKAKYHYGGNYLDDLSQEQAFVHTGMFLGWLLDHDLSDPDFWQDEETSYVASFKAREITGARVYESVCDGALTNEMLSAEGNAFARFYYDGDFLSDYEELLGGDLPSLYHVEDTWGNYHIISRRISDRYADWKRRLA